MDRSVYRPGDWAKLLKKCPNLPPPVTRWWPRSRATRRPAAKSSAPHACRCLSTRLAARRVSSTHYGRRGTTADRLAGATSISDATPSSTISSRRSQSTAGSAARAIQRRRLAERRSLTMPTSGEPCSSAASSRTASCAATSSTAAGCWRFSEPGPGAAMAQTGRYPATAGGKTSSHSSGGADWHGRLIVVIVRLDGP